MKLIQKKQKFSSRNGGTKSQRSAKKNFAYSLRLCVFACAFAFCIWGCRSFAFGQNRELILKGVKDMVRISDGRMSGTAYGTVVLHISPESSIGGTLALVKNGDFIELDVANRKLHLEVSDEELNRRRAFMVASRAACKPRLRAHLFGACAAS